MKPKKQSANVKSGGIGIGIGISIGGLKLVLQRTKATQMGLRKH